MVFFVVLCVVLGIACSESGIELGGIRGGICSWYFE